MSNAARPAVKQARGGRWWRTGDAEALRQVVPEIMEALGRLLDRVKVGHWRLRQAMRS